MDGSVIGIVYLGTICSMPRSVSVSQDFNPSEVAVGALATHELGHNFDMFHDDSCE